MKTFFALPQTTLNLGFSVVCATHGYALIHLTNLSLVPSLVFFSAILLLKVLICDIILPYLKYDALVPNGTWELVPSDSSYNIVGCKWIFELNVTLMVLLIGTKHAWLRKAFISNQELTIMTLSVLW